MITTPSSLPGRSITIESLFFFLYLSLVLSFGNISYSYWWEILQCQNTSLCLPPSVIGEVYCFPHCQLIFSFDRRVMYHLKGLWEYIPKSISFVCTTIFVYASEAGEEFVLISTHSSYASPSSRDAYLDRQLTPNFELWVEIFCVPTCFHVRIP